MGRTTIIISALCIFAEDYEGDNANGAATALSAAGYEVHRLPPALKAALEVEGDDFIEVRRQLAPAEAGVDETIIATWFTADEKHPINVMWADVEQIVDPFGASVDDVGPASNEPFEDLFRVPENRS